MVEWENGGMGALVSFGGATLMGWPFDIVGPASRDSGSWCVYQVISWRILDEQDTGPLK